MRNLLILSVLSLILASSSGCFHRGCCGSPGGNMFGWRQQPQQMAVQCCDPCANAAPMMQAPCCP